MSTNTAKTGGIVAGAGCLFGLAPLLISFAALAVGSNIGNVLHWYTLFTAPVGGLIVVVGLITAIVGASKSGPEDFAASIAPDDSPSPVEESDRSEATPTPVVLPPVPPSIARSVKLAYAIGFGVLLVSCIMRVTLFQPGSGILTFFDLLPAAFAGWFVYLARGAHNGLEFLRLHRSQMIVSIAGCVAGLYPLIMLADSVSLLSDDEVNQFQWGGTIITGIIPLVASIASLTFSGWARSKYRASIAKA